MARERARTNNKINAPSTSSSSQGRRPRFPPIGIWKLVPAAVVVTDAVTGIAEGAPLVTCIEVGETTQDAPCGAPLHAKLTMPVKLAVGDTCRLYVAVCPAATLAAADPP